MIRRQRRPEPKPWAYDWRNPDMLTITRIMIDQGDGYRKETVSYLPEEMTELAQESLDHSKNPDWKRDPSYRWNRRRTNR